MPSLIGTLPDQLPTNGDLGELAFQNKDSVEFYDGRGGLQHLVLTAIKRNINVTALDVFVYDTSKDSDGGAWRSRTQHTSWYNETLNTTTRGSRREFPAVAVIVATTNSITIYDGDFPDMPMWMVFNEGAGRCVYANGYPLTAVTALNGILSWAGFRLGVIRFISDSFSNYEQSFYNYSIKPLSERNGTGTTNYTTSPVIVNLYTNDVAMTVLPNAPIDPATGLPIPTIAVATNSGVSVIRDDGTVDSTYTSSSADKIVFVGTTLFALCQGAGVATSWDVNIDLPAGNGTNHLNGDWNGYYWFSYSYPSTRPPIQSYQSKLCNNKPIVGGSKGLSILSGLNNTGESTAFIASTYNTGWMLGDIKGAWLSDTTQENMIGNVTPDGSGWYGVRGGSVSGTTTVTVTTGSQLYWNGASIGVNTIVGRRYIVLINVTAMNPVSAFNIGKTDVSDGAHTNLVWGSTDISTTGIASLEFTATSSTSYVIIENGAITAGYTITFDSFSVRLADPDRSVNNKGLQVFGNITKTPVAAGADLVAYSGFSVNSGNYLKLQVTTAVGAGDFSVVMWYYTTSSSVGSREALFTTDSGAVWTLWKEYTGYLGSAIYADDQLNLNNGVNTWQHIAIVRRSGVITAYVNGKAGKTSADAYNHTSVGPTYIGVYPTSSEDWRVRGSMALVRYSATAPSAEQIAKMYNDEKVLFQDNAKATLYGTSDAVTALAYDEDTNLLHVGTSSGRSVFNGLRRVDNTTDAVGACISAAGGLVVED